MLIIALAQRKSNLKINHFSLLFLDLQFLKSSEHTGFPEAPGVEALCQAKPISMPYLCHNGKFRGELSNTVSRPWLGLQKQSHSFRLNMNKKTAAQEAAGSNAGSRRGTRRQSPINELLKLPSWSLNYLRTFQLTANKFPLFFGSESKVFCYNKNIQLIGRLKGKAHLSTLG